MEPFPQVQSPLVSLFLRSQAAAYLLLVVAAASWAGNHVIARAAGGHVPPASLAVVRWIIVALAVLPFALAHLRTDWPRLRSKPGLMVLFAVTGGGAFGTLQFTALHFTTAINMGVVGAVAPAFIVAVSFILFRDRLTPLQLFGVLVSLSGVVAIVSRLDPDRLAGFSFNGGDLIIIANMVLWASISACLRLRGSSRRSCCLMAVISGLGNLPFAAAEHAVGYRLQATS
jgi:drug/metabolite transporter (DMT)-like permease